MSTLHQVRPRRQPSLPRLHDQMAGLLDQLTAGTDDLQTPVDNLMLFRREGVTEPCECMVEPSIVLVVQGAKQLLVGDNAFAYDAKQFLITSLDLPARTQVLDASPDRPALGLVFKLDMNTLSELISQNRLSSPGRRTAEEGAYLGAMTQELLEPFDRLLKLLQTPEDIPALAPLIQREIHYRLLKSDVAEQLWQFVSVGSQSQRIARAIDWLKANYTKPLHIDDLAAHLQMSPSSLHHNFRRLTAKSPLQYQKWLRLSEARRLMLNDNLDAARASFEVGYESPSQFSREYSRLFGAPPRRDIEALRNPGGQTNMTA